jgi:hypothetical protein
MFKITYQKVVARNQLAGALGKLFSCQQLDQHTAYRSLKILKKLQAAGLEFGRLIDAVNVKFSKKDEAGLPITVKDEQGNTVGYEIPDESRGAYDEAVNVVLATEVEIPHNKLQFSTLAKAGFSPQDYDVLDFMIEGQPED